MRIAIQQPEHLPWLGFFHKMAHSDLFIFLDNVQFKKRYFENRNIILSPEGPHWLTIPVKTSGKFTQKINEVEIDYSINWQKKYLGALYHSYSQASYFRPYYDLLNNALSVRWKYLVELNLNFIEMIKRAFHIPTRCIRASELTLPEVKGSDLILSICRAVDATEYISGPDGPKYLKSDVFSAQKIQIKVHEFRYESGIHEPYLEKHLSALHYLFKQGETTFYGEKQLSGLSA